MANKKRLFLIDGMSNIFRSYYAIRGLSNSRGIPTNAVFGFTMTLRKLISQYQPDYLGVVLDSKEKTFRHDTYEHYKANRTEMPDDLVVQLPNILRVCEAFRVPVLRIPGFEADDIMGTLAHKAAAEGLQAVIVSSDKDLCQLVRDPDIVVLRFDKNGEVWYDEAGVKERLGVRPTQVADLLGLMGDSSDNIPGAPGIGEKGAAQIIEEFGSIEAALAGWEQVKKKTYRESLRDNVDQIRLSRELATIDVNVPVELDIKSLELEPPDVQLAHQLFSELEFGTLAREFAAGANPETVAATAMSSGTVVYKTIATVAELDSLIKSLMSRDRFAFAFAEARTTKAEAGNLFGEKQKFIGVAISIARRQADYFDFENCDDRDQAVKLLRELFDNGFLEKAVHDLKRAMHLAEECKIHIENVVDDTLIQAYLLDAERTKYELPDLAREYLGIHAAPEPEAPTPQQLIAHQALVAADLTGQLADALNAKINEQKLDHVYLDIELPLVPLIYEMECAGFRVDPAVLRELSIEMQHEMDKLAKKIYELAGQEFNINSPGQVGDIFEKLNFEVSRRTSTGKISTSRDVLDELASKYELPRLIIEYRELAKLKGTYVDSFPNLIS
ncbi:MAG TPA: DNA polymerase, partial [Blastocatellia bacterium]|nr:DNA polymerase [Blastocatellia bacterium]